MVTKSSVLKPNGEYNCWILMDQNLVMAICSTIFSFYVLYLEHYHELWIVMERRLQTTNRSRVIQLKNELHNLTMKNQSMDQWLTEINPFVDNITSAGAKIDTENVTHCTELLSVVQDCNLHSNLPK